MFIQYTAEEAEPQRVYFEVDRLTYPEAERIEQMTGQTIDEFRLSLMKGGAKQRRVMWFILQKRVHPTFRFEDFAPQLRALTVEFDRDEWDTMIAAVQEQADSLGDDPKAEEMLSQLAAMRVERDKAEVAPDAKKVPSLSVASDS